MVYNGNGGAGTTIDTNSPYLMGATVTTIANAYTRAGYTFGNWNTKADGSGTAYGGGGYLCNPDNVTPYAQWLTAVLSVTYDGNGGTNDNNRRQQLFDRRHGSGAIYTDANKGKLRLCRVGDHHERRQRQLIQQAEQRHLQSRKTQHFTRYGNR